jgi:hypothetical protein
LRVRLIQSALKALDFLLVKDAKALLDELIQPAAQGSRMSA